MNTIRASELSKGQRVIQERPMLPGGYGPRLASMETQDFLAQLRSEAAASLYRIRTTPPRSIR